ncbi:MAG: hypothetical protein NVSMB49_16280 [Ktedonobacteraceae bacterium]
MDYTPLPTQTSSFPHLESFPVVSLYEALQGLPDPRRGQGKRSCLALVLCLIILAKLAGQKTLSGATEWLRHRRVTLVERFGLKRSSMPCHMTYCDVLAMIDGKHLDEILSAFFERWEAQSRCGDEPSRLQTQPGKADHRHLARDSQSPACHQQTVPPGPSAQLL